MQSLLPRHHLGLCSLAPHARSHRGPVWLTHSSVVEAMDVCEGGVGGHAAHIEGGQLHRRQSAKQCGQKMVSIS
jgi:hypothetical protein